MRGSVAGERPVGKRRLRMTNRHVKLIERARVLLGLDREYDQDAMKILPAAEARRAYGEAEGPLARIFFDNDGRIVDKWLHYIPVYERYLDRYRGTAFKMLEIGVFEGGSLEMWRRYFGPDATLFGVDIDPRCASFVDAPNQVRIGSQADPAFLEGVVREMGGLDVVLDDGSHVAEHQEVSFDTLFPLVADGGLYIIEDLHTSYWRETWNGGYRRPGTGIEISKTVVDDMHHWYHGRPFVSAARADVAAVHFYDSIVVIEKRAARAPIRTQVGSRV